MVFHSALFLFGFLPLSVGLYAVMPGKRRKNLLLAALSVLFYAFDSLRQVPVLLLAAAWNYAFGRLLDRKRSRALLILGAGGNLALLGVYKYLGFLLGIFSLPSPLSGIGLPLGISFFTFHGVSYLADVYQERARCEERFGELFLYLAFFPRLVAGPIVRWRDAAPTLDDHPASWEDTAAGLRRFVRGMVKKLVLAEGAAAVVNGVYALAPERLGSGLAWCAALAYCLQIFYDFSGYSDMAIGLGRCFGFRFPENFNYPYISRTLSEFWRRWHMTLNRWFVDYLYIPLGGSRKGEAVTVRNKLIVFFFTGLWHGAGWTFLLWGLWHGVFVALEGLAGKTIQRWETSRLGRGLLHGYTLLAVTLGFVFFRAGSLSQALGMLGTMFSFAPGDALAAESLLTANRIAALLLGIVFCLPIAPRIEAWVNAGGEKRRLWGEIAGNALALLGLGLAVLALSGGGFTPFIYQQF